MVIMPTYMVAAIILMHRKGIMEHILIHKVEWIKEKILKRGGRVSISENTGAAIAVRNSINLLKDMIQITKKTVFELSVQPKMEFKNILMLNYYRNGLIHVFVQEALCAVTLCSFGVKYANKEGIHLEELWHEFNFLN